MERIKITHPNRKTLPHDVRIYYSNGNNNNDDNNENLYFSAHRLMIAQYPYFSGVLSDLSVNDIYLPFSKEAVDKLLDLIYTKTWHTWGLNIIELIKLLSYVGIYHDEWFNDEFKKAKYIDAREYLAAYGIPMFIAEGKDHVSKYKYLKRHYNWGNEQNEAFLFAKYICCIQDAAFYEYLPKLDNEYAILRYICLLLTEPDSEAYKKLHNVINTSRHGKRVPILPNYKCLRNLHKYKHHSSRSKKSLYRDFLKVILGEGNDKYDEKKLEDPEINSSSSSEEIGYTCFGGDDGW